MTDSAAHAAPAAPAMLLSDADLSDAIARCADEPIRIPGSIQPHGALLVLSTDATRVLQASTNTADVLGHALQAGHALDQWPGAAALLLQLQAWLGAADVPFSRALELGGRMLQASAHLTAQGVLLELEPAEPHDLQTLAALYPRVQRFMAGVESENDIALVCTAAAREVRQLTGFDRVLVYHFNADWHGTVIAEDGNGSLPSYLDLRFPASDIPPQARALYRQNRVRIIADANYTPVPVLPAANPLDGGPLDLSAAALRSVSPVHLQYMRNMGTLASMSVSIVIDGELWGLLACHNAVPRRLSLPLLSACDFLGQMLALQIGARERSADSLQRLRNKDLEVELLARMSRAPTLQTGLVQSQDAWLALLGATGAAVLIDDAVLTAGKTPNTAQLQALAAWVRQQGSQTPGEPVFATDRLPSLYAPAAAFSDTGCGLVAVSVSALYAHYVLWFRPELIHTVRWGGKPDKARRPDGSLEPRRSFEIWSEIVSGRAPPWTELDLDAAHALRNGIINFVLKRAEERAALSSQLQASNKELEAFSYSISHDLRAPFRHIVGFAQLLREQETTLQDSSGHYLDSIIDAALSAGRLVDDLLDFSQLARTHIDLNPIDMNKLVAEMRQSIRPDERGRQVEWTVSPLPPALGDASLLRQAMVNLLDNALKYTRHRTVARISISGEERAHETVYTVSDNGVGFDMAYVHKLFGVFQRLHRVEEFEGSGIGLALARRIVDRHGGWIAAEGRLDAGATFRIGLPRRFGPSRFSDQRPGTAPDADAGADAVADAASDTVADLRSPDIFNATSKDDA